MSPERWKRIEELFDAAVELAEPERSSLLARECGADAELRSEVESLLASSSGARESLQDLVANEADRMSGQGAADLLGTQIGPYKLDSVLGEGGMGAVYLATRGDDEFPRRVAIKILHRGYGTQAIARFRDERQILAALDHPGIVKLLDGGRTEHGLPYLMMEHIDGVPIGTYAREHRLSVRARVELLVRVCGAVHYAHGRLVVHRDLKPSNLLVTAEGAPKLLDFGIAKLLAPQSHREARTRTGMLLLTPEYASPEQVRGEPVTVATDVYALGALLYELLAERAPLSPPSSALEMIRVVSEVDPPRPSAVSPAAWRDELAGDLDNIVLKALHKEPGKRYASAGALADDLQRYLDGRPVAARTPTLRYRAGKFVRRNRGPLAIGAAIAAVLSLTVSIATVVAMRDRVAGDEPCSGGDRAASLWRERKQAVRAALLASGGALAQDAWTSVERKLDRYTADWAAMHENACRTTKTGEQSATLLDLRMRCLDERLEELGALTTILAKPDAELVGTASRAAQALGRLDACADTSALLAPTPLPPSPLDRGRVAELRSQLAHVNVLGYTGKYQDQLAAATKLVPQAKQLAYAPLLGEVLAARASALDRTAQFAAAADTMREAGYASDAGGDHKAAASARTELVWLVGHQLGQPQLALEYARDAEARIRGIGGDAVLEAKLAANESQVLEDVGRQAESDALGERVLERRLAAFGPDDVQTAIARVNVGVSYSRNNGYDKALPYYERALVTYGKVLGEHHPLYAGALMNIADTERALGKFADARTHGEQALKLVVEALGPEHNLVASVENVLGLIEITDHHFDAAEPHLRRAVALAEKLRGPDHLFVARYSVFLAQVRREQGDAREALALARRAVAIYQKLDNQAEAVRANGEIGMALAMLGDRRGAQTALEHVLAVVEAGPEPDNDPANTAELRFALARVLAADPATVPRAKALANAALASGDDRLRAAVTAWLKKLD